MVRVARLLGFLLPSLTCALGSQLAAQEYCVACSEPDAVYRCVIEGAKPGGSQPLQMLCITTMAKQGRHATCGIKRGTVFECDGAVKRIPWMALNAPPQSDVAPAVPSAGQSPARAEPGIAAAPPTATPPPAASGPEPPPQTVLELAKRANEDTAKQFKKAGETVKEATKKTWDCVASFFTQC